MNRTLIFFLSGIVSVCGSFKDPIESDKFEGDMLLNKEQLEAISITSGIGRVSRRNAVTNPNLLWPDATVFYRYAENNFNQYHKATIERAMSILSRVSCVKFKEVGSNSNKRFTEIFGNRPGCASSVGYTTDMKIMVNTVGCRKIGSIQHELMHTLGFYHMHMAYDRDDYIEILWNNIPKKWWKNFLKTGSKSSSLGVPYDYGSIMHYRPDAYSKDLFSKSFITKKDVGGIEVGQRKALSPGDILKLNRLYKCPGYEHY